MSDQPTCPRCDHTVTQHGPWGSCNGADPDGRNCLCSASSTDLRYPRRVA